jgi:hypothetical protein
LPSEEWRTEQERESPNRVFCNFKLPLGKPGDIKDFENGAHVELDGTCHRLLWNTVRYVCVKGKWTLAGLDEHKVIVSDGLCHGSNDTQSGQISCGYAPER